MLDDLFGDDGGLPEVSDAEIINLLAGIGVALADRIGIPVRTTETCRIRSWIVIVAEKWFFQAEESIIVGPIFLHVAPVGQGNRILSVGAGCGRPQLGETPIPATATIVDVPLVPVCWQDDFELGLWPNPSRYFTGTIRGPCRLYILNGLAERLICEVAFYVGL